MTIPTGDPELDMLLAALLKAYYGGDCDDLAVATGDLLRHYGVRTTEDNASNDGA